MMARGSYAVAALSIGFRPLALFSLISFQTDAGLSDGQKEGAPPAASPGRFTESESMTAEEYYGLVPESVAPRLVKMARDFAALADADKEAAARRLDDADVIFAVWQDENGGFGFMPVFGGDRLAKREKNLRVAALFAPSEIDARMLAYPHELAPQ